MSARRQQRAHKRADSAAWASATPKSVREACPRTKSTHLIYRSLSLGFFSPSPRFPASTTFPFSRPSAALPNLPRPPALPPSPLHDRSTSPPLTPSFLVSSTLLHDPSTPALVSRLIRFVAHTLHSRLAPHPAPSPATGSHPPRGRDVPGSGPVSRLRPTRGACTRGDPDGGAGSRRGRRGRGVTRACRRAAPRAGGAPG